MASPIDELFQIIRERGGELYGREAITQREHALQCALEAESAGAGNALIAAALLHDIGHLIDPDFDTEADEKVDLRHESKGAYFLSQWFSPAVTEPIRLHVAAKRYLSAMEPGYYETLSPASVHSLELQGGRFDAAEAKAFAARRHGAEAIALRRWDDRAKVPGRETPDLEHYRAALESCLP
jgi:phosphonate degradation associated HDIG domain protein